MIPSTVVGLLVFVAGVGPGYLFVRLSERRHERRPYTPLEEAAEMLVVGGTATIVGILASLALSDALHLIDADALAEDVGGYLSGHPARGLGAVLLANGIAYGVVGTVIWLLFRGKERPELRQTTLYYAVFTEDRPDDHGVLATLELRDGRKIRGAMHAIDYDGSARHGHVSLYAPVGGSLIVTVKGVKTAMSDRFILLDMDDVIAVSGLYTPIVPAAGATH